MLVRIFFRFILLLRFTELPTTAHIFIVVWMQCNLAHATVTYIYIALYCKNNMGIGHRKRDAPIIIYNQLSHGIYEFRGFYSVAYSVSLHSILFAICIYHSIICNNVIYIFYLHSCIIQIGNSKLAQRKDVKKIYWKLEVMASFHNNEFT